MTLPLEGIRIVDLTQVMAGPFCTMLLGDLGADVIKVEPPTGDLSRSMGGARLRLRGDDNAPFLALNRNKRSVVLDLKEDAGLEAFRALVRASDVVVENFRPGVAGRLGVDYESLSAVQPALVYASISGFGQTGPYADRPGFDLVAQGMSGVMSVTGEPPGPLGSAHRLNAPYQAFRTGDGWMTLAALTPRQWESLCRALGREALADDPRFRTNEDRMEHRPALVEELEEALSARPTSEWVERLLEAGVPAGPIHDFEDVFGDPHTRARDMVEEVEHPVEGLTRTLGFPLRMSDTPPRVRRPPPLLGQHTDEVLDEVGAPVPPSAGARS